MGGSAIGHIAYALVAVALVALAATVKTDGYIANILMQATTYAIAVFGLSIVLGLCGQINLAQAAFFALGAYCVGLGTADYRLPFWLCLAGGVALAFAAGAGLGLSTLRLGGHYLAMVTISFQQILTRRPHQRDRLHPWAGRRQLDRAPRRFRLGAGLSGARRLRALDHRLSCLAPRQYAARARDACGARQRACRERLGNRRLPHQGHRLRALRGARRVRRRAIRRGLFLCQPRPVLVFRFDRLADDGAAWAASPRRSAQRSARDC